MTTTRTATSAKSASIALALTILGALGFFGSLFLIIIATSNQQQLNDAGIHQIDSLVPIAVAASQLVLPAAIVTIIGIILTHVARGKQIARSTTTVALIIGYFTVAIMAGSVISTIIR